MKTTDMQRIRITELDDFSESGLNGDPRVPRSMDIEVREDLVNQCFPGDAIRVTGIVKTMQVRGETFSLNKR